MKIITRFLQSFQKPNTHDRVEEFQQSELPDPEFGLPETRAEYLAEKKKRQEETKKRFDENRVAYTAAHTEALSLRRQAAALRARKADPLTTEMNRREAMKMEAEATQKEAVEKFYFRPDSWMGSATHYGDRIVPFFVADMQSREATMIAEKGEVLLDSGEPASRTHSYGERPKVWGWTLFRYDQFFVHVVWEQDLVWEKTGTTEWVRTRDYGGDQLPVYRSIGSASRVYVSATRDFSRMKDTELNLIKEIQVKFSGV